MRRRLLLSYLSITIFVLVVLEVPLGLALARSERRELASGVQHDALALSIRSEEAIERNDPAALGRMARDYQRRVGGRVVVVDGGGRALADSDPPKAGTRNFADRPEIEVALDGREGKGTRYSSTLGSSLFYAAAPIVNGTAVVGALRVSYPTSFVDRRVRHNWLVLGVVGLVVLVVVFLVSLVLVRSVSRPLGDLESAADRFGSGDLSTRAVVPRGPAEVRVLAEAFNQTATRLERLVHSQQAFVADASHQLRSPLAALRLRLENLEDEVGDPISSADVAGALAEVARLSRQVDGLLALARAEQQPTSPVTVDVAAIADDRREAWSALAAERPVRIEVHVASPRPFAMATPGRLEQVLDNLLNNALDVVPVGSAIVIDVHGDDEAVELEVRDAGPGMTAAERARAFDRFWRARDAAPGGAGLGLAIVRELIEADGGTVRLDAAAGGGLAVSIRLPSAAAGATGRRSDQASSETASPG